MHNANKVAVLALTLLAFMACQPATKMGGSPQKATEKKHLPIKQTACFNLLNASDIVAPEQLVGLWHYSFKNAYDAKAGKRTWVRSTGIIIGPNAILGLEGSWPGDPNPGPIKIQRSSDLDSTAAHLAQLPEVETIIRHPSLVGNAMTQSSASTVSGPSVDRGFTSAATYSGNEWDKVSERVVILKSRLANLPQYFRVSEKRRMPGEQVTLLGTGERTDLDDNTASNWRPAVGTNTLLDSAGLSQEFSWMKNDATYLIGGRRTTGPNTATTDSMPADGDHGSAMVQGNTLLGMNLIFNRQDLRGLLGKESLAVYFDLSSKFAQELIAAAIEKKADIVKENAKPEVPECKAS